MPRRMGAKQAVILLLPHAVAWDCLSYEQVG